MLNVVFGYRRNIQSGDFSLSFDPLLSTSGDLVLEVCRRLWELLLMQVTRTSAPLILEEGPS